MAFFNKIELWFNAQLDANSVNLCKFAPAVFKDILLILIISAKIHVLLDFIWIVELYLANLAIMIA